MFFFQAEDGIRDLVRSRGLGDVYKRQGSRRVTGMRHFDVQMIGGVALHQGRIAEMRTGEGLSLIHI